ncbi:MAG TPA: DUF892 family protein [Patescibacteria group bacterium]
MHKETYIGWLNDAYSMEVGLVPVLENHEKDAEGNTEVQEKIQEHIEQTKKHAEMIKACIERNGEDVSSGKETFGSMLGKMKAASTGMYKDEVVKNALADYTAEHFEIASYQSLIAAATEMEDDETKQVCQTILGEEEDMAAWLAEQIPTITKDFMRQQAEKEDE